MKPTVGRVVLYRSRSQLGYTVPAIITATLDTLHPAGVLAGHVPPLSGANRVHLHVLSPAIPGDSPLRASRDPVVAPARFGAQGTPWYHEHGAPWYPAPRQDDLRKQVETEDRPAAPNVGGGYQEWDVPFFPWGPDVPGLAVPPWTGPGEPPRDDQTQVYVQQPPGTWTWPPRV